MMYRAQLEQQCRILLDQQRYLHDENGQVHPHLVSQAAKETINSTFLSHLGAEPSRTTNSTQPRSTTMGGNTYQLNSTAPLKPPGCFKRAESSHSVASTAASATTGPDEEKQDERCASPLRLSLAAVVGAKDPRTVARDLRTEKLGNGNIKISWPVDAKKLSGKDKQIISPSFEIFPGSSFKLMIKAKSMGDRKGQANFQKARGFGSVELKLLEGTASAPTLRFRISLGGSSPRETVEHDFGNNTVGGLPGSENLFDLKSAVDSETSTVLLSLEVLGNSTQSNMP